jgi:hypothetical protein
MKLLKLFFLSTTIFLFDNGFSQQGGESREFDIISNYRTPRIRPNYVLVENGFSTHVKIYFSHTTGEVWFNLKPALATWENPSGGFATRWLADGKEYNEGEIGMTPFYGFKLAGVTFNVTVTTPEGSVDRKWFLGSGNIVVSRAKGYDINAYSITINSLESIAYDQETYKRMYTAVKSYTARLDVEKIYSEAVNAINNNQIETAKQKITEGERIVVNNQLNDNRFQLLREKLPKLSATATTTNKTLPSSGGVSSSSSGGGLVVESRNETPTFNNSGNIKTASNNGSGNGYFTTNDGRYFIKDEQGDFIPVDKQQYENFKNKPTNKPEIDVTADLKKIEDRKNDIIQQTAVIEKKMAAVGTMMVQNYYHGEAIKDGLQQMYDLSMLSGNFSSIQEINQQYYNQRSQLNGIAEEVDYHRQAAISNYVNATTDWSNPTDVAISQGVGTLAGYASTLKSQADENRAKAELDYQRKLQIEKLKDMRRDQRLTVFEQFKEGGVPLTYHKVTAKSLYFFIYCFDSMALREENTNVTVSKVFKVDQYNDGTYIFKSQLIKKIQSQFNQNFVLVGYFIDSMKADLAQQSFVSSCKQTNCSIIQEVIIKMKNTAGTSGTVDFWEIPSPNNGNNIKSESNKSKLNENKQQPLDDFWKN